MRRWLRRIKDDRAQAITEFVLVLPIFVLLLFSMLELGRIFNAWISVTAAAREGARLAAVQSNADFCNSAVTDRVRNATAFSDSENVTVRCGAPSGGDCSGPVTPGQPLCVRASYPVTIITPIVGRFFDETPVTISSRATMRRE